ncbi:hypothetical protein N7539_002347 [Penicillium diatomitis]|uniref:F-box domain-containing protein n=1 Tax=Penicillium diatomitis TaxID=2819901 RepID=A0A9X0BYJ7_9EURO|nr:uncharacterized protein N7539_002347 [Penicillium diatomitis]KAJ5490780.1 hypothetical protein N7539_002347 [Penicillium diatomitis]
MGWKSHLDRLDGKLLSRIMDHLHISDIESLSCTNKRLRDAAVPILFRAVRFEFSTSSLKALESLANSDIRHHVRSLAYAAPEILRTEILDFDCFASELLTLDDYSEWIDESQSFLSDECPSYMLIYDVLQDICEEQQEIMSESMDKHALLHVFSKLVRLQTLTVCFCPTVEEEEWVGAVLARGLTMEDSCEYHSRVIHDAIEASRRALSNEPDLEVLLTVQPP